MEMTALPAASESRASERELSRQTSVEMVGLGEVYNELYVAASNASSDEVKL